MVRPLPLPGANDFLHALQLMLRDQPGMAERAAQVRAVLPEGFARVLVTMERMIAGESTEDEAEEEPEEEEALANLSPEQRREMQVLAQVFPAFEQAAQSLHDPKITFVQRMEAAKQVDGMATKAAEGEELGSPWLDAAAGLRGLATLLRGGTPDIAALGPVYRKLLEDVKG
jgi:hypothetical protein